MQMTVDELSGRRVLVTGASGTIGTAVCDRLADRGARVTALSLPDTSAPAADASDGHDGHPGPSGHQATSRSPADRIVHGDTTDPTVVTDALAGADLVVHLAAIAHPGLAAAPRVYGTNVTATFNVLWQAGELGIRRAVTASSINASGIPFNTHRVLPAYYPIDERLPVDHDDPYSLSKYADEATARAAWRRWGIDIVALRFPHVTDAGSLRARSQQLSADPAVGVREGWSYLDVRDAARAVELALTADCTGAHPVLVAAADTLVGSPTDELLDRYAAGAARTRRFVGREVPVDLTAAHTLLGFRAEHTVEPAACPPGEESR